MLVTGGFLMWLNSAFPNRANDNIRRLASPDGKHEAVLFRRTSRDSSAYSTHVTVLPAGQELPNRSGKAFIAEGEPSVRFRWTDSSNLVIDDPDGTKVIFRASQIGDVRIKEP